MLNALANAMLWPGMLVLMLLVPKDGGFISIFYAGVVCSLLGTLFAGALIPVKQVFMPRRKYDYRLHTVYGSYKRKIAANPERLARLGDDGELIPDTDISSGKIKRAQID